MVGFVNLYRCDTYVASKTLISPMCTPRSLRRTYSGGDAFSIDRAFKRIVQKRGLQCDIVDPCVFHPVPYWERMSIFKASSKYDEVTKSSCMMGQTWCSSRLAGSTAQPVVHAASLYSEVLARIGFSLNADGVLPLSFIETRSMAVSPPSRCTSHLDWNQLKADGWLGRISAKRSVRGLAALSIMLERDPWSSSPLRVPECGFQPCVLSVRSFVAACLTCRRALTRYDELLHEAANARRRIEARADEVCSVLDRGTYKLAALQLWSRLTLAAALTPSESAFMADLILFASAALNAFACSDAAEAYANEWRRGHDAARFDAANCKLLSLFAKIPPLADV